MTQYEIGDLLLAHERRLERLEKDVSESLGKLERVDERTAIMFEVLVPKRKRQSERPGSSEISIKTGWGTIRGRAPWVALVALVVSLGFFAVERLW
jgi:hypothetical protein